MLSTRAFMIVVAMFALTASAAWAQTGPDAAAACANPNSALPPALSGWAKTPIPLSTAHNVPEATGRPFPFGQRVALKLDKTDSVTFAHQPGEQMPKQY